MGALLSGQSFGYALSLSASFILSNMYSPSVGFLFCLGCAFLGIFPFLFAIKKDLSKKYQFDHSSSYFQSKQPSQNKFLVRGYTAHCVELFGMWSWLPVFLSFILIRDMVISPLVLGLIIGLIRGAVRSDFKSNQRGACWQVWKKKYSNYFCVNELCFFLCNWLDRELALDAGMFVFNYLQFLFNRRFRSINGRSIRKYGKKFFRQGFSLPVYCWNGFGIFNARSIWLDSRRDQQLWAYFAKYKLGLCFFLPRLCRPDRFL